jgi:hypothetical protein
MNPRETKLSIACVSLACALIIFGAVTLHYYIVQRDVLAGAQAFSKAKQGEIAQKDKLIADAGAQIAARDKVAAEREKDFQKQIAAVNTPQDAARVIKQNVPSAMLIPPLTVDFNKTTVAELKEAFPDAPSVTCMSNKTAEDLAKGTIELKRLSANVQTLTADNADLKTQVSAEQGARADAEAEARRWQTAARGTVARRVVSAGKWAVIGAVVTLVVTPVLKH